MNNQCLVSIIIPAYKAKSVIDVLLGSIEKQTHKKIQVIISPDDDECYQQLVPWGRFFQSIVLDSLFIQSGPEETRNRAIPYALGDYIVFLDADDYIDPDFIEKMLEVALVDSLAFSKMDYISWDMKEIVKDQQINESMINLDLYKKRIYSTRLIIERKLISRRFNSFAEDILQSAFHFSKYGCIRLADTTCHNRLRMD